MRWRRKKHSALDTGTLLLALILTVSTTRMIAPHFITGSSSYFSDVEWAKGFFSAGILEVDATVDIDPDTLKLNTPSITCYIELPNSYNVEDIDISTIKLKCGSDFIADAKLSPIGIGDYDDDSITDLMVKFDKADVIAYLLEKVYVDDVTFTVTGEFTGWGLFTGEDIIKVIP